MHLSVSLQSTVRYKFENQVSVGHRVQVRWALVAFVVECQTAVADGAYSVDAVTVLVHFVEVLYARPLQYHFAFVALVSLSPMVFARD